MEGMVNMTQTDNGRRNSARSLPNLNSLDPLTCVLLVSTCRTASAARPETKTTAWTNAAHRPAQVTDVLIGRGLLHLMLLPANVKIQVWTGVDFTIWVLGLLGLPCQQQRHAPCQGLGPEQDREKQHPGLD